MRRWIPLLPAAILLLLTLLVLAQDATSKRASRATLADDDEPGQRMTVVGTVYLSDGETPAHGIEVFVYHADRDGLYNHDDGSSARPRLKATVVTDEKGRFELDTIVPGAYPRQQIPAHVHFVFTDGEGRTVRRDLNFEGDPFLSASARRRSEEAGRFASIRPHQVDEAGRSTVTINFRL